MNTITVLVVSRREVGSDSYRVVWVYPLPLLSEARAYCQMLEDDEATEMGDAPSPLTWRQTEGGSWAATGGTLADYLIEYTPQTLATTSGTPHH